MVLLIKKILKRILSFIYPELKPVLYYKLNLNSLRSSAFNTVLGKHVKLYPTYKINNTTIGDYTYIAQNSQVNNTSIGKFCSIGPSFKCGWGIHPTNGLSTSPVFYSTLKQNGITFTKINKIEETKPISIGNDVFIGRDVIILDGVTIGNGAVIGAGTVVSKDIPDFAVAVGCPVKVVKYRFSEEQRKKLNKIKWWDFNEEKLKNVEKYFFDIDGFIKEFE